MGPTVRYVALALALTLSVAVSAQQSLFHGTGILRGRVVDAVSGAPVAGVNVGYRFEGVRGWRWAAETDSNGGFSLQAMPSGTFEISTSKPGYVDGLHGQRRPFGPGQTIELKAGEEITGLDVRVSKEASVSGRVVGSTGQVIGGAIVRLMRVTVQAGTRFLEEAQVTATDTSGRYEMHAPPATYAVALTSTAYGTAGGGAAQQFLGYPTTYHPNSPHADGASLLTLKSGDERRDVNFTQTVSPMVSVTGALVGPPRGEWELQVELVAKRPSKVLSSLSAVIAFAGPNGQFRFPRVSPGEYLVRTVVFPSSRWTRDSATMSQRVSGMAFSIGGLGFQIGQPVAPLPPAPTLWAEMPLTVGDRNLAGLTLTLKPGARISGRIQFRGASTAPTAQQLLATPVAVLSADFRVFNRMPVGRLESDGQFATAGLPPGRYIVAPSPTPAVIGVLAWDSVWRHDSTVLRGQALPNDVLTVGETDIDDVTTVFSDVQLSLDGLVRDASGAAKPDATIYVFPADRADWTTTWMREVRPSRAGRFTVSDLRPGEYLVAAVISEPPELWNEATFLATLEKSATRVRLLPTAMKPIEVIVR